MKEDLFHYIWKFGLFDKQNLRCSSGEEIEVIHPGEHNHHSGPDFFNAKVRINGTLWAGNVEIHVRSQEWQQHKHHQDAAYNNVILHVVFENNAENHLLNVQAKTLSGERIPELELKYRIFPNVVKTYEILQSSHKQIPCAGMIKEVAPHVINPWLERMAIERLEQKQKEINELFEACNKDWQETFYRLLAKNFGFKTNADAFLSLAISLPFQVLMKHRNDLFQMESLLFGQAGMLDEHWEEAYPKKLQNEYEFLRKKYSLVPVRKESWKFLRMRPVNFPTLRIAQLAALLYSTEHLFSKILECVDPGGIKKLFEVKASEYWNAHYSFTAGSPEKIKHLGEDAADNIIINTVAPLLFYYGRSRQEDAFAQRAIDLLDAVDAEDNKITREYTGVGVEINSAMQSQGLINLSKNYCSKHACLSCAVGGKILNKHGQ